MSVGSLPGAEVREEIIARVRGGIELAEVERDLIDPARLSEDEKAALWLLAWCETRQGERCPRSS